MRRVMAVSDRIRRGESRVEAARDNIRAADVAQNETLRRKRYAALQEMRSKLLAAGVPAASLPDFSPQSSLADIATATRAMETLGRSNPGGAVRTAIGSTTPVPVVETAAQMEARTSGGTANALAEQGRVADANSGVSQDGMQSRLSASEPSPSPTVRTTGAGREELVDSRSGPRWVAAPLSGEQVMQSVTGTNNPAERAAFLRSAVSLPDAPRSRTVAAPQRIYSDALGRDSGALGARAGATEMGRGTLNPDGTVNSIVGGAGITEITGGKTTRSAAGNVAVGKYGSGSSTFDAIPSARPAQGSQTGITTGVKAATPAPAAGPNTNLSGPASSTGEAFQSAPRPPVPQPATSPIASNASTPAVASPSDLEDRINKRFSEPGGLGGGAIVGTPVSDAETRAAFKSLDSHVSRMRKVPALPDSVAKPGDMAAVESMVDPGLTQRVNAQLSAPGGMGGGTIVTPAVNPLDTELGMLTEKFRRRRNAENMLSGVR